MKHFEFSFTLRTCLHLNPDVNFNIDSLGTIIKTEEIHEEHDSRYGTAKNMEITSDTDAAFRFTRIKILVPDQNKKIPLENLEKVYAEKILSSVNMFINSYRDLTGRYGINNISNLSDLPDKNVGRPTLQGGGTFMKTISFTGNEKGVTLSLYKPYRSTKEHEALQKMLTDPSLSLSKMFLMDAYKYHQTYQDIQSLINAIVALELSFWDYNIPNKFPILKPIYRFFSRYKNLQINAKYFLKNNGADRGIIECVTSAIKERNRIVHKGQRNVMGNMKKYLKDISHTIELISQKRE